MPIRQLQASGATNALRRMRSKGVTRGGPLLANEMAPQSGARMLVEALANKNVRTAWALVIQGTEYQRRLRLEMAA